MDPGQTLSHYRILKKIGQGGLAEVFLAEDLILNRKVALKFLSDEMSQRPDFRAQFLMEARNAASIDHPFICKVYETGAVEERGFIALEFIEGQTLGERLDAGPLPFDEAFTVITQLAEGIAAAHEHEVVHGDIKPTNIMISSSGHVKIMDFGLAKHLTERPESDDSTCPKTLHTLEGVLVGTPAYMAPEQIRGEWADARSDVFSMGLVYFQVLSGIHPFRRRTSEATMAAILHEQTPALSLPAPHVPVELGDIVNRMLNKQPALRYASSREVLEDLKRFSHSSPISIQRPPQRTVAILPFLNLSPDPNQEYFCDGLVEELITALSNLEGLRVASRTSSFSCRGSTADIREIGDRLKVEAILEGSVRKAGDRVRIVVKLVAVNSGYPLWSERYDRQLDDIFEIQDEISRSIVEKLKLSEHPANAASTSSIRAYELYLKGRFYWNKRTEENLKKSIEYFKMALDEDPSYALALAGRADAYVTLALYGALSPADVMPRAKESAEEALKQEPAMPEALTALATIHAVYNWNWAAAERMFKQAIQSNPNYAGAHQWYAIHCLAPAGRFPEARAAIRHARELDPLSLAIITTSALELYFEREYDAAIQEYRRALDLDPNFGIAHYFLGQAYFQKSMFDEGIAELERAVLLSNRSPECVAVLGYGYAITGHRAKAEELAGELETQSRNRYVSPALPAWIHLGLDDREAVFEHLARAYRERATDLIWLRVRPVFDAVRSDPRFEALCSRLGF
jgi:serine/threonine protein kinase/Flp pilus assembly protein TadD